MTDYSYNEMLAVAQSAGSSLSNSTSQTSILPAHAKATLPAGYINKLGKTLLLKGTCRLSNIVTTPGTLTLDVKFGSVVVFTSGALQLSTTAHTTLPLRFEIELTARALGSGTSANLMGQGVATSQCLSLTAVADSTTTPATLLLPNTTPTVGSGFDSTAAQAVDLLATFSIANAGNLIQLEQYTLQSLN